MVEIIYIYASTSDDVSKYDRIGVPLWLGSRSPIGACTAKGRSGDDYYIAGSNGYHSHHPHPHSDLKSSI